MPKNSGNLRVVLISGSYSPREGGAERQWRAVLESLASDGATCLVVTQVLPSETRREVISGVTVFRVGSRTLFRIAPRLGMISFLLAASYRGLLCRPTVLASSMLGAATGAAAVASLGRRRHVIRLTGGGTEHYRSEPIARANRLISRVWCNCVAAFRPIIVAPADHLVEDYNLAFPNHRLRKLVIPNGVGSTFHSREFARQGVVWYARSGSMAADQAFLSLVAKLPEVQFVTFGRVLSESRSNVTQLGWLDDPSELLASSKLLVNTTPTEGMPNVVLQALASGTTVVGFANAGMREVAKKYSSSSRAVRLIESGNIEALASSVAEALVEEDEVSVNIPTVHDVVQSWKGLISDEASRE